MKDYSELKERESVLLNTLESTKELLKKKHFYEIQSQSLHQTDNLVGSEYSSDKSMQNEVC